MNSKYCLWRYFEFILDIRERDIYKSKTTASTLVKEDQAYDLYKKITRNSPGWLPAKFKHAHENQFFLGTGDSDDIPEEK